MKTEKMISDKETEGPQDQHEAPVCDIWNIGEL